MAQQRRVISKTAVVLVGVLLVTVIIIHVTLPSLARVTGSAIPVKANQSPTPVLMKAYIYAEGRLVATATGSATAYESDVATRPAGNGLVGLSDWVMTGRFSVGLETPPGIGSEYQRVDSDCSTRCNTTVARS